MTFSEYIIRNNKISVGINTTGGCVSHLLYKMRNGEHFPIFRIMDNNIQSEPFAGNSCLFPMVPFVNRIRNNQFNWHNKTIALANNIADPFFFLHGDGWLRKWHLIQQSDNSISLQLPIAEQSHFPFQYQAILSITLNESGIDFRLEITNCGEETMPFGAGFHPFFHVCKDTKIQVLHSGLWLEDEHHLPTDFIHCIPDYLNFNKLRLIPDNWINNGYFCEEGLQGTIMHNNNVSIYLFCSEKYIQMYKPSGNNDFFCIEPQTQFVDAHNDPQKRSLHLLKPQEKMAIDFAMTIDEH